jgi:iron complex transport system substrate-binding protein
VNRLYTITIVALIAIIISVSFYGVFMFSGALSTPSSTPTMTPQQYDGETLTIKDDTGINVTVPIPAQRIVSLDDGHTELLCALGAQNRIVGRDTYSTFPPSISNVTDVGEYTGISVEAIVELEPDVVLAMTTGMEPGMLNFRYASGIPVLFQDTANFSKIEPTIRFLGKLVGNESGAEAIIEWMNHYMDLVDSRVSGLSDKQKPTFYLGGTRTGLAEEGLGYAGPDSDVGRLGIRAGGTNVIDNSTKSGIINNEFVIQENPEYIFSMTSSPIAPPTDIAFYLDIQNQVKSRTGFDNVPAVKNNHVFCYDYTFVQGIRYPVGMLYFAKCMHPDLFADVDPTEVLEEMTQMFFGIAPPGIYTYP